MIKGIVKSLTKLRFRQYCWSSFFQPMTQKPLIQFLPVWDVLFGVFSRLIFQCLFKLKKLIDELYGFIWNCCLWTFQVFRQCIHKLSSNMWPTETLYHIIYLIISSISICMEVALKIFKKCLWVFTTSSRLILKESYWMGTVVCSPIYPHIRTICIFTPWLL